MRAVKNNGAASDSLWSRHGWLLFLAMAAAVAVIGFLLDHVLVKEGLPGIDMLIISNSITGLFAAGMLYQVVREERAKQELVQARMKTIAELNHHIRNALQVIKFWGAQQRPSLDAMQLQLINDSVDRIEWALREVLPRYQVDTPIPIDQPPQVKSAGPAA